MHRSGQPLKGPSKNGTIFVIELCPFSKWVEEALLPNHASSTVIHWLHSEVMCFYGTPRLIRCDYGGEFWGSLRGTYTILGAGIRPYYHNIYNPMELSNAIMVL